MTFGTKNFKSLSRTLQSRSILAAILLLIMALALPASLAAQSFVYVNNQDTVNTVSGFVVSNTGTLNPIPGSPFATGGAGSTTTCYGLDRMVVSTVDKLLFVSNPGDQTISVFQIDSTSGALTIAPGSPANSGGGLTPDGCGGMSLAVTPDGKFLMASSGGSIQSFNVDSTGALTPAVFTSRAATTSVGMKISTDGKFLALSNERNVAMFNVNATGSLTAVTGSPFARQSTGLIAGFDMTCKADKFYAAEASFGASSITDGWTMDATGALTKITGSPFLVPNSTDSNVIALNPDDSRVFISDQLDGTITSFNVNTDGTLAKIGTYGGPGTVHVPAGIAIDPSGAFLYVADDTYGVGVFSIATDGSLSLVGDVPTIPGQSMQSVATYPTRSCVTGDLSLAMTASAATVATGANVTYTITITNTSASPAAATITDALPANLTFVSCSSTGNGVCTGGNPHTITFSSIAAGGTETVTLVGQVNIDQLDGTVVNNTASITAKSITDTDPTNDTASASFTVTADPNAPTTLTVTNASGNQGGSVTLTAVLERNMNGVPLSGRTVSFSLNGAAVGSATTNASGTATLSASLGTITAGYYPGAITASYAGETTNGVTYQPSTGAGNLTVNKPVLTVVPTAQSMTYGGTAPTAYPYTFSGFVNGDTSAVVTGTATCTSVQNPITVPPTPISATTPAGSYSITCDISGLSAANYTIVAGTGFLTVNPAPLTVVMTDSTRLYGDPNDFSASTTITGALNGDKVVVTYLTSAQITSAVGSYPVTPSVSGNYVLASGTGATLTILPAPLSVVVNNATRKVNAPNPPFTGTITGIKNADPITPVYSTTAIQGSPAGIYPITATLQDPAFKLGNYTVSITNGTLTITRATLVVTVNNANRPYGSANPTFTGTITGLNPGDVITATYSTTATAASPVGDYPITATLSDPNNVLGNYTVSIVNGDLTVSTAPLTVTINNASRVYGNANPTLKGTISGLVNGDSITATYSAVGATAPVGNSQITPVFSDPGAKLGNYTVTIIGGTLTITPAPLTVTAVGGSRVYGGVNPTPTLSGLKNGDPITATITNPGAASPVGTYTITPVIVDPNLLIGNYTVTLKTATLSITKAPLTITADSVTVILNTTKAFTATFTGLVLNQDPTVLTGTLSCTAAVNTVGTHPITCSGVSSPNYTITFVSGTATVHYAGVNGCNAGPGHEILAPINVDGTTVFTRATTASIPVQFRVCDASGASVSTAGVVSTFRLLRKITGTTTTTLNQSQSTAFTFDATAQDWLFNLSTASPTNLAAGSTYVYQILLNDGTSFNFQFSMN